MFYILVFLFVLQIMGLGFVMSKLGEPKSEVYSGFDAFTSLFIATLLGICLYLSALDYFS